MGDNIFGGDSNPKKNNFAEKKLKSDETNPFSDDEEDGEDSEAVKIGQVVKQKGGFWSGWDQNPGNTNPSANPWAETTAKPADDTLQKEHMAAFGNDLGLALPPEMMAKKTAEQEFDEEFDKKTKSGKFKSPFDMRVEDKMESAYEFVGRKLKNGAKAIKRLDKTLLGFIKNKKKDDEEEEEKNKLDVEIFQTAQATSMGINSFFGGDSQLGQVDLTNSATPKFDIQDIINEVKNDRPVVVPRKRKPEPTQPAQNNASPFAPTPFLDDLEGDNFDLGDTDLKDKKSQNPNPKQPRAKVTIFDDDFANHRIQKKKGYPKELIDPSPFGGQNKEGGSGRWNLGKAQQGQKRGNTVKSPFDDGVFSGGDKQNDIWGSGNQKSNVGKGTDLANLNWGGGNKKRNQNRPVIERVVQKDFLQFGAAPNLDSVFD